MRDIKDMYTSKNRLGSGRKWSTLMLCACCVLIYVFHSYAVAAPTYQDGRITNVTFVGSSVFVMLDSGLPDNCAGTPSGWMIITDSRKPMQSFVIGLWMRGDAPQIPVRIFTSGITGTGYCEINQIDPAG